MNIIGELINASRKRIARAIKEGDAEAIQNVARDEEQAGAAFIDVNAGVFQEREVEYLRWLVQTVQQVVQVPCSIDSPSARALGAALEVHQGPRPIINSISLEKERFDSVLPLVEGGHVNVIALCMSDDGMPEATDQRLAIADQLISRLVQRGVPLEQIYVDALVQPISTNDSYCVQFLGAVRQIMERYPGIHTICGLSNVSFGLPKRKILNRALAVMGIANGLDSAICNPLDDKLMSAIYAAEALAGRDEYCGNYIEAYRAERLAV